MKNAFFFQFFFLLLALAQDEQQSAEKEIISEKEIAKSETSGKVSTIQNILCGLRLSYQQIDDFLFGKHEASAEVQRLFSQHVQELPTPKIFTSLSPNYPLSPTRMVLGSKNLGYFNSMYFLTEFPFIYIMAADIDNLQWINLYIDNVSRNELLEFDDFIIDRYQCFYLLRKDIGGHLLITQSENKIQRNPKKKPPVIEDMFTNTQDLFRIYYLNWNGEGDVKGLAAKFLRFLEETNNHDQMCLLSQLPPAGLDQIKCDFDYRYEEILHKWGGISDIYHPPVFYSFFNKDDQEERLPLSNQEISNKPFEYFTRNYPNLQLIAVSDELSSKFAITFVVPNTFKLRQNMLSENIMDLTFICHSLEVHPEDERMGGGFLHLVIYQKKGDASLDLKEPDKHKQVAKFIVSNIGKKNLLFCLSFNKQSSIHMPGLDAIKELFKLIVRASLSRSGMCLYGTGPCGPLDLKRIRQKLENSKEYLSQISLEIPKKYINYKIPIFVESEQGEFAYTTDLVDQVGGIDYFSIMEESEGLYLLGIDLNKQSEWIKINVTTSEETNVDGFELSEQGYISSVLRTYNGTDPSINLLAIMKYKQKISRKYAIAILNVYEKIEGLSDVEKIFILAFSCYDGYRVSDNRMKAIFTSFINVLQKIEINEQGNHILLIKTQFQLVAMLKINLNPKKNQIKKKLTLKRIQKTRKNQKCTTIKKYSNLIFILIFQHVSTDQQSFEKVTIIDDLKPREQRKHETEDKKIEQIENNFMPENIKTANKQSSSKKKQEAYVEPEWEEETGTIVQDEESQSSTIVQDEQSSPILGGNKLSQGENEDGDFLGDIDHEDQDDFSKNDNERWENMDDDIEQQDEERQERQDQELDNENEEKNENEIGEDAMEENLSEEEKERRRQLKITESRNIESNDVFEIGDQWDNSLVVHEEYVYEEQQKEQKEEIHEEIHEEIPHEEREIRDAKKKKQMKKKSIESNDVFEIGEQWDNSQEQIEEYYGEEQIGINNEEQEPQVEDEEMNYENMMTVQEKEQQLEQQLEQQEEQQEDLNEKVENEEQIDKKDSNDQKNKEDIFYEQENDRMINEQQEQMDFQVQDQEQIYEEQVQEQQNEETKVEEQEIQQQEQDQFQEEQQQEEKVEQQDEQQQEEIDEQKKEDQPQEEQQNEQQQQEQQDEQQQEEQQQEEKAQHQDLLKENLDESEQCELNDPTQYQDGNTHKFEISKDPTTQEMGQFFKDIMQKLGKQEQKGIEFNGTVQVDPCDLIKRLLGDQVSCKNSGSTSKQQNEHCIVVYSKCDFQGQSQRICGSHQRIPEELHNMEIRSIQSEDEDTIIEIYGEENFGGNEVYTIHGSAKCLNVGLNVQMLLQE